MENKVSKIFKSLPTTGKVGVGIGALFIGRNLFNSMYSGIRSISFGGMHSGKEDNLAYYSNMNMTDFGSKWKGLSDNILRLVNNKNAGLSRIIKETVTPFTCRGVDLGKTMIKMNRARPSKKVMKSIKIITHNPTLELHKHRNIGHIVS